MTEIAAISRTTQPAATALLGSLMFMNRSRERTRKPPGIGESWDDHPRRPKQTGSDDRNDLPPPQMFSTSGRRVFSHLVETAPRRGISG
jgi:hypothetical protein